jgi:hypothetical protein
MKYRHIIAILLVLTAGCSRLKKENDKRTEQLALSDTSNQPKTDIQVHKNYDDQGNLIQYDSTYSYFYSSPGLNKISSDSVFKNFQMPLHPEYKNLFNDNMQDIFFNDSLFKYDFYNGDYFSQRYQLNMKKFENMFRQMDSLKSDWMQRTYPNGNIRKK